jgi:hypothetical protein
MFLYLLPGMEELRMMKLCQAINKTPMKEGIRDEG